MKRLNIHQIDTTGATDGDGPVYDAASGRVIWASASGGIESIIAGSNVTVDDTDPLNPVITAAGTDPEVIRDTMSSTLVAGENIVITPDDAGDTVTISAPGSSGGAGAAGLILLEPGENAPAPGTPVGVVFKKTSSAITYDFRTSLPAGWTPHGSVGTPTFDGVGMTIALGGSQGWAAASPYGTADQTLELDLLADSNMSGTVFGPCLTDGSGTGVLIAPSTYNGTKLWLYQVNAWANGALGPGVAANVSVPLKLRVVKSGTSYTGGVSHDGGATWVDTGAWTNTTATDTIGFNCSSGGMTVKIKQIVVKNPAVANSGKALGWWDGSQIQPLA